MFAEVFSGFSKFFTPQRVFILVIFFTLTWLLLSYSDAKTMSLDGMGTGDDSAAAVVSVDGGVATTATPAAAGAIVGASGASASPTDLLPADQNSEWAALNPVNMSQGNIIAGDMLQAGYHIGLDTIGQSMKNANLQLRSDPIIPKQNVGPWNQSTYEPDYARVPLEIGACTK
jgi:hypothetical protein